MKRLIEKGLMFGNMIRVDSPAWVARYNRALKLITGKEAYRKAINKREFGMYAEPELAA